MRNQEYRKICIIRSCDLGMTRRREDERMGDAESDDDNVRRSRDKIHTIGDTEIRTYRTYGTYDSLHHYL